MPQAVKVRSDIEVGCYAYEGVDAVKNALRAGIACGTEDMPIKINLIAPPRYVVTTSTLDKEKGVELLKDSLAKIEESIKASGGIFTVTIPPKVVTDFDEAQYARMLEQAEKENIEVSGDDDDEFDEDGDNEDLS
ncbi:hypothetical protein SSS_06669 [Sarcoptes scabiei]|nr:hypothetical protein SSS_06669 [Sarcoptes scabiei]